MATYTLLPTVKRQFLDNSGNPLSSGKVYTVEAGGTYPADAITTYQTSGGTAHTNPIILDSAGRISGSSEIYAEPGQSYKLIVASSASDYTSPLWTQDNIGAVPLSTVNVDIEATAGQDLPAASVVFMAKGTEAGSLNAGSFYKTDADAPATSIDALTVAMAPEAITNGSIGTVRLEGDVTVSGSSLVPGQAYFASAVAGELTSTPPTNARYVGQAKSSNVITIVPNPPTLTTPKMPSGRLTLTTNVPVTTSDVTAATTLYFTPYAGNTLTLYDGTAFWLSRSLSQLSIAVPATTNTAYDVFVYDNVGVPTLELTAWTNLTTRATALTTQNGMLVKTGATTRLYLGSFRTTGVSGQTEDSDTKRYVWNYYNRVPRRLLRKESTANWAYTTATFRQANASASNQVEVMVGVAEVTIDLTLTAQANNDSVVTGVSVGFGEDSTSSLSTSSVGGSGTIQNAAVSTFIPLTAALNKYPAVGSHTYVWLEASEASGTTTWYGSPASQDAITGTANGITGSIWG